MAYPGDGGHGARAAMSLLERGAELAALEGAVDRAARGKGAVVAIEGERVVRQHGSHEH